MESQSDEIAILTIPPLWSDALYTCPIAALKAGVAGALLVLVLGDFEQAVMPRVSAVAMATAVTNLFFIYWRPFSVGIERCGGSTSAGLWIERVAQAVAEDVEGEHGDEDRHARPEHEVRHRVVVHGVREHAAPRRGRRADADAEEGQRRLEEDVRRDQQRRVDQDRREQVWQHLAEDDARRAGAQAAGRVDELTLAQRQCLTAHDAGDVAPVEEADDEDQRCDAQRVTGQPE